MATVAAATGGRTEQHPAVADRGLTDSTGKVQPTGGKHTEGACIETLKCITVSQDWLSSTAVPGSMTDGLYGLRCAIPSPESALQLFLTGSTALL